MQFQRGDAVIVRYFGHSKSAMVILASRNGASLMLSFEGALWNRDGGFFGSMPVLRGRDGVFRDLLDPPGLVELEMQIGGSDDR